MFGKEFWSDCNNVLHLDKKSILRELEQGSNICKTRANK